MIITSSIGEERDVDLDVDRIIAYEKEHPEWSLMAMMSNMDKGRMTDFDTLAYMCGFDGLKDLISCGFTINDLSEVVQHSRILGFTGQE